MGSELNRLMQLYGSNNTSLAQTLGAMGRHGDSLVAHITPKEAMTLKAMGGAGTVNPLTGLLEFYDSGQGDNSADANSSDPGDSGFGSSTDFGGSGFDGGGFSSDPNNSAGGYNSGAGYAEPVVATMNAALSSTTPTRTVPTTTGTTPTATAGTMGGAPPSYGFELSRLMRSYGVDTPSALPYGGQTAAGTDKTYQDYIKEYQNRLLTGNMYNQAQFYSEPNKFVNQTPKMLTAPIYNSTPVMTPVTAPAAAGGKQQDMNILFDKYFLTSTSPATKPATAPEVTSTVPPTINPVNQTGTNSLFEKYLPVTAPATTPVTSPEVISTVPPVNNTGNQTDVNSLLEKYTPVTSPVTAPVTAPETTSTVLPTGPFTLTSPAGIPFEVSYTQAADTAAREQQARVEAATAAQRQAEAEAQARAVAESQARAMTDTQFRSQILSEVEKLTLAENQAKSRFNQLDETLAARRLMLEPAELREMQADWRAARSEMQAATQARLDAEMLAGKQSSFAHGGHVRKRYAEGGEVEDPNTRVVTATRLPPEPPVTPPQAAAPATPAAPPARPQSLEDLFSRYAAPGNDYTRELASARQAARTETEAFSNMIRQMAERGESPTSRAEMYFRLASAFGSPTRTGMFTENLALAGKEMGEYAKGRRADEAERRGLALKAQELKMAGARQDLATTQALAAQEGSERRALAREILKEHLASGRPQSDAGKMAQDAGLTPGTPEYSQFVNRVIQTKMESGELFKQAMLAVQQGNLEIRRMAEARQQEAEKQLTPQELKLKQDSEGSLSAAQSALRNIEEALERNRNSFGTSAADRAQYFALSRAGSTAPRVINTQQIENLLGRSAIDSLKEKFGAGITNEERRALTELEGALAKTPEERRIILERTRGELQRSIERERTRLRDISSGVYRQRTEPTPTQPGGAQ